MKKMVVLLCILFGAMRFLNASDENKTVRDNVLSTIRAIIEESHNCESYEEFPSAEFKDLVKSQLGVGIIMKNNIPTHVITTDGYAPLIGTLYGNLDDVIDRFHNKLDLCERQGCSLTAWCGGVLYSVGACNDKTFPKLCMRDITRDAIFSVVQKIIMKSKADCTYELCPDAALTSLFKSTSGYGIILRNGLPSRMVTPRGVVPLIDLKHGNFNDVDTTKKFFYELKLSFYSGSMPLQDDEKLYAVNQCDIQALPQFGMK